MTSPGKLGELHFAGEPALRLLERLGCGTSPPTILPRNATGNAGCCCAAGGDGRCCASTRG